MGRRDHTVVKVSDAEKLVFEHKLEIKRICHLDVWRRGRGHYRHKGPEVLAGEARKGTKLGCLGPRRP